MTMLHLLQLSGTPIFEQLQIEEALLRIDRRNWCIINKGSPPAIVMGISGKSEELIDKNRLREAPIPLIRRFSGGGTVVVDEDTYFITFICNSSFVPIPPFPEPIMRWTESIYKPVFFSLPFRLLENDYVMGHQKCGGNAQSICKNRWLHHSSLLWDYSSSNMGYLKMPSKVPAYRDRRSHVDFLCRIREHWSEKNHFLEKFLQVLHSRFPVEEVKEEEIIDLLDRPHRRATELVNIFD